MAQTGRQLAVSTASDAFASTLVINPPPLPRSAGPVPARREAILSNAVETQVIPRLLRARIARPPALEIAARLLTPDTIASFTELVLANRMAAAEACVADLRRQGAAIEALYLDLLAPAARHLGHLWDEDLCDFTQVTVGLFGLQTMLRDMSAEFVGVLRARNPRRRALLLPSPGETHTLGLMMVSEFFRRDGWAVWSGMPDSVPDLVRLVRREWFAVIGFSMACGVHLDELSRSIRQVRQQSSNRAVVIMVGGPVFLDHPRLAQEVGADATSTDGPNAVSVARGMVAARAAGTTARI